MPGPSTSPPIPQPPTLVGRSVFRGLVRSLVPYLQRHDGGNTTQALPGVRCIFFVSLSCLYMLRHTVLTLIRMGGHPLPHLDYWVKASDTVTSLSEEGRCLPTALAHHSANNVLSLGWDLDLPG